MPSTIVHVALGLLLAAGVLGRAFDRRAAVVVAAAVVVPDLDVFASLLVESTHRAMLHSLLVPGAFAGLLYYDTRIRGHSWVAGRHGTWGVQVAWTALLGYAVAGIGLDAFSPEGVNLFYPVFDQFVSLNGEIAYSTVDGFVQTFVEVSRDAGDAGDAGGGGAVDVGQRGSTAEVHVGSGVDPERGPEPPGAERVFPVAYRGWQLTVLLTAITVVAVRLRRNRLSAAAETVTGEAPEPGTTD